MKGHTIISLTMIACLAFLVSCANHREPPKVVNSGQSTNSVPAAVVAQLQKIGMENHVGVYVVNHTIFLITAGSSEGLNSIKPTEDSIRKVLGNDFTNYTITVSAY